MEGLEKLENESIYILREGYFQFKRIALLWSMGKDSTILLWLAKKAFLGKIPFPIIHIDTGYKFEEIYSFRSKLEKEWGLNLLVAQNHRAIKKNISPEDGHLVCCTELKTNALKQAIKKYKFQALFLGIRRDEHGIRAKERVFSPRDKNFIWNYKNQPPEVWNYYKTVTPEEGHIRIHPLLGWREIDIWEYIKKENLPVIPLYFAKNGKRYRSIGCKCCCKPISSNANTIDKIISELKKTKISERSGRTQDKEQTYMMQKLRAIGYM
jgi:sulfate adenylyltransferase subunit 2